MSPGSSQPLVYTIRSSVDVSNFSWNDKKTRQGKESPILTRTCLSPLSADGSAAGILFRRLHLYNIERMDSASLCTALSICRSLVDLEIVGLHEADFEPRLIAWKSMDDPSPGDYVHELDYSQGLPQYEVVQVHMRSKKCRSGQWNGVQFVGCSTAPNPAVVPVFVYTETEISFMFEVQDRKLFSIVKLNYLGVTQLLVVNRSRSATWNAMIEFPSDPCDFYGRCGANAICNDSLCGCVKGLLPNSLDEWTVLNFSNGCKRTIPLNCSKGEGFWEIENVKLPDQLEATLYRSMSLEECKDECIGCRMWFGDLIDMRVLEEGNHVQTLYVRQSASKLDAIRDRTRSKIILVAVMLSSIIGGLLLVGTAFWGVKHKKRRIRIGGKSSYRIVSSSQEAIKEFKTRS